MTSRGLILSHVVLELSEWSQTRPLCVTLEDKCRSPPRLTLTEFVSITLQSKIPCLPEKCFFEASLNALTEKHDGIRPIVVGNTLRRLATKVGCAPLAGRLCSHFCHVKPGYTSEGGCAAATHTTRRHIANASPSRSHRPDIGHEECG